MLSVYDTECYKLHYSNADLPSIEVERGPLDIEEARNMFNKYVKNPSYTHVYVTKDNIAEGTSIQVRGDF